MDQLRLDLGCGPNKRPGFTGVDSIAFPGVDVVCNLAEPIYDPLPDGFDADAPLFKWLLKSFDRKVVGYKSWHWPDCSVVEAHSSHFVEHLTSVQRIHFVNELHRVLVPGGKCQIIVPHWASCRAYGDPSHQWSAVSEFWFYYLSREWRLGAIKDCPGCLGGTRTNPSQPAVPQPCPQCSGNSKVVFGANAPHADKSNWPLGFDCDFDATWGYGMHGDLLTRSQPYQQFAMQFYKESILDIHATLTCRK